MLDKNSVSMIAFPPSLPPTPVFNEIPSPEPPSVGSEEYPLILDHQKLSVGASREGLLLGGGVDRGTSTVNCH